MRVWLNEILDREGGGGDGSSVMKVTERFSELMNQTDGTEIAMAECLGDIEPLRTKYPHLADYLYLPPLPKRRRGQRNLPAPTIFDSLVKYAASDARRIRKIWKSHYGTDRRGKGQESAEDIALSRWSEMWGKEHQELFRRRLISELKARKKSRPKS